MNTQKDLETLQGFISVGQLQTLAAGTKHGERPWFRETLATMAERVATMPKTDEQDGVEDPVAHLHYFVGSADWYITEKDMGDEQLQAFGLADLGLGFPEMGYISIEDVIGHSAELDLHFDPTPLSVIKAGRA